MNKFKIIHLICILLLISACKSNGKIEAEEYSYPVIIEEFSQGKFHHSDTTILTIRRKDSLDIHLFGLQIEGKYEIIQDGPFELDLREPSIISFGTIPLKFQSEKKYVLNNQDLVLRKYYFDIPNEADEEGYYFVANNRIIAFSSTAWNLNRFYKYEDQDIAQLLKKDTTEFLYHKYSK